MLTAREAAYSLFGAYRMAMLDPSGMQYFDRTPEGALRSFYAALLALPGYALLLILRLWPEMQATPLPRFVAVEGIAYIVSWTAFALTMVHVTRFLDRADRYVGFLCAYNWSAVIQTALYVPTVVIAEIALPGALGDGLVLGVMMAMLAYQWFIARTALEVGGGIAAAIVMLDLVFSIMINGVADGMLG